MSNKTETMYLHIFRRMCYDIDAFELIFVNAVFFSHLDNKNMFKTRLVSKCGREGIKLRRYGSCRINIISSLDSQNLEYLRLSSTSERSWKCENRISYCSVLTLIA